MLGPQPIPVPDVDAAPVVELDPVALILHASGPVFLVVWLLIAASILVWVIAVLKVLQLRRWAAAEHAFEREVTDAREPGPLFEAAARHPDAPGARVVTALSRSLSEPRVLGAAVKQALVGEQQRASTLMPTLASIGSASPFIGLFGTVYGIMDAFLRIGREKSASLPVVAPAIGEALIATAIGLFAAIPAVIAYNAIAKRMDDQLSALEAASDGWLERVLPAAEAAAAKETEKRAQAEAAAQRLAEAMQPRVGADAAATAPATPRSQSAAFDQRATQPRTKPSTPPPPLPKS